MRTVGVWRASIVLPSGKLQAAAPDLRFRFGIPVPPLYPLPVLHRIHPEVFVMVLLVQIDRTRPLMLSRSPLVESKILFEKYNNWL